MCVLTDDLEICCYLLRTRARSQGRGDDADVLCVFADCVFPQETVTSPRCRISSQMNWLFMGGGGAVREETAAIP